MIWWFYNLLFPVAFAFLLPHFLLRMFRRGGYARDFSQRFGRYGAAEAARLDAPGRPIWIQAVSVGELAVAFSFMEELRRRDPQVRFVLTTNTSTGVTRSYSASVGVSYELDLWNRLAHANAAQRESGTDS